MTLFSVEELLASCNGQLISPISRDFSKIEDVATDSRLVKKGSLFVPLIGEKQDGHAFIKNAISAGASAVLVSSQSEQIKRIAMENPSVPFVFVQNTLKALQDVAEQYVSRFPNLLKCAVTGSSGKTTTKEFLSSILSTRFSVISTKGNLNSETGLPLSVFGIQNQHEAGVFELGMNRVGEMAEISRVLKPNYVIITNIGSAHLGKLGSREKIASEKKHALDFVKEDGIALVPLEDDFADFLCDGVRSSIVRFSLNSKCASLVSLDALSPSVIRVCDTKINVHIPGRHNALDAIAAALLSLYLGVSPAQIKEGIESVFPSNARSEVVRGTFTVVKDCYNANPDSLKAALRLFSELPQKENKKIVVLGEMLELGDESKKAHEEAALLATKCGASLVILVGDEFSKVNVENVVTIPGRNENAIEEAARLIQKEAKKGDLILLKGSRAVALERILPLIGM